LNGLDGEPGNDGIDGQDGRHGRDGEPGDQGLMGYPGLDGEKGPPGRNGQDGQQGDQGPMGNTGPEGPRGLKGNNGEDGLPGLPGQDGEPGGLGPAGPPGETGPASCNAQQISFNQFPEGSYNGGPDNREYIHSQEWGTVITTIDDETVPMIFNDGGLNVLVVSSDNTISYPNLPQVEPTAGTLGFTSECLMRIIDIEFVYLGGNECGTVSVSLYDKDVGGNLIWQQYINICGQDIVLLDIYVGGVRRVEVSSNEAFGVVRLNICKPACITEKHVMTLTDCWRYAEFDNCKLCLQFYSQSQQKWISKSCTEKITCNNPALNVAIVVDVSGSITTNSLGNIQNIRDGVNRIVSGLGESSSKVAISSFATVSPPYYNNSINSTQQTGLIGGYFTLPYQTDVQVAQDWVNTHVVFHKNADGSSNENSQNSQYTNWQAAFISVESAGVASHFNGPLGIKPDLIIFITDGAPNAYYTNTVGIPQPLTSDPRGGGVTRNTGGGGNTTALNLAAAEAKYIMQNQGSRIISLGVGDINNDPNNLTRLKAVTSNYTNNAGGPQENTDYFIAVTYEQFNDAVSAILESQVLCDEY